MLSVTEIAAGLNKPVSKRKRVWVLREVQSYLSTLARRSDFHAAMRAGDCAEFLALEANPSQYSTAREYYIAAANRAFLRKYEGLGELLTRSQPDPEARARETFFAAEQQCRETNARLRSYDYRVDTAQREIVDAAQAVVARILGRAPSVAELELRFGPGATSACRGASATIASKLTAIPECYRDSVGDVSRIPDFSAVWFSLLRRIHPKHVYRLKQEVVHPDHPFCVFADRIAPSLVPGNTWVCVPKDAKTHRGICIEAHGNVPFQLGIGAWLSNRLARWGLDKATQPDRNRYLASVAQRAHLATVDLSSASDTLAYETVRLLLQKADHGWFELFERHRAPRTLIGSEWVELEKFSSMGNGYTFELETIIFYALARACTDTLGAGPWCVATFGDDIILPRAAANTLTDVLAFLGFTPNLEKTFTAGSFFESCGSDWFDGFPVRPYHLKEQVETVHDLYKIYNGFWRFNSVGGIIDPDFEPVLGLILDAIPEGLRLWGPPSESDQWLISSEVKPLRRNSQLVGFWGASLRAKSLPWGRYCELTRYTADLYRRMGSDYSRSYHSKVDYFFDFAYGGIVTADHVVATRNGFVHRTRRLPCRGRSGVSVGFRSL